MTGIDSGRNPAWISRAMLSSRSYSRRLASAAISSTVVLSCHRSQQEFTLLRSRVARNGRVT